jgi:hypothetical protein
MARKPSHERLAEFQTYLGFFRAMWAFQEKLNPELRSHSALPNGTSYGDFAAAQAQEAVTNGTAPFSALLTGMKQGVADQLEMTRDLPQDVAKLADGFLVAAGAVTLTEMRRRVWRVIPKVLERGRIRTLDEFYVVKNVLDDNGEDLSGDERARLDKMRFEYETRSVQRRVPAKQRAPPRSGRGSSRPKRPALKRSRR